MANYNIEDVYKAIYKINNYFGEIKRSGITIDRTDGLIRKYCQYGNKSGYGNCRDYLEKASSGVINLLITLKDKNGLEYDKLAEYAILWLRYKLNQKSPYNSTKLNDFYTKYVEKNKYYDEKIKGNGSPTYKEIIDKKKDLMDMNIKEMSKFNYPFSILVILYNEIKNNKLDCKKYLSYPENFANKFKELNNDSSITGNTSYRKLLSTLSYDYNNLKNKYDNKNSCNFPPLSELNSQKSFTQNSLEGSGQTLGETLKVTSSSSSISTTLIPALSTFSVIPVFLGIAYKYSLFGVDKLFQRQYLRKKLKKITKKMKLNI
ncbi:CIR protein PIR protein [Plasmodium vinckei]|uniref:CIR protein PIR protein n=1 Tax=Plasmodium vinckei TaxID=5860 RepID=A0A6V7SD42_PLAVN|nr:CIR protein PIR protein [Plasmodium vinckei]